MKEGWALLVRINGKLKCPYNRAYEKGRKIMVKIGKHSKHSCMKLLVSFAQFTMVLSCESYSPLPEYMCELSEEEAAEISPDLEDAPKPLTKNQEKLVQKLPPNTFCCISNEKGRIMHRNFDPYPHFEDRQQAKAADSKFCINKPPKSDELFDMQDICVMYNLTMEELLEWKKLPQVRKYSCKRFLPGENPDANPKNTVFNLWRGWNAILNVWD